jgi:hypothetical protein
MSIHDLNDRRVLDRQSPAYRAMVASGWWLRAGFVALSIEVIALIMLATGEASPWLAIAAAVVAGVFARWSWHKARAALDAEAAETNGSASAESRATGYVGRVETAVTR